MPERFQLSRARGTRLPPGTINVARPGRYGNPFRIKREAGSTLWWVILPGGGNGYAFRDEMSARRMAVQLHLEYMLQHVGRGSLSLLYDLHGKNVACWCALGSPCHGDTLLMLANSRLVKKRINA